MAIVRVKEHLCDAWSLRKNTHQYLSWLSSVFSFGSLLFWICWDPVEFSVSWYTHTDSRWEAEVLLVPVLAWVGVAVADLRRGSVLRLTEAVVDLSHGLVNYSHARHHSPSLSWNITQQNIYIYKGILYFHEVSLQGCHSSVILHILTEIDQSECSFLGVLCTVNKRNREAMCH